MKKRNVQYFILSSILSSAAYAQEIVNGRFKMYSQKPISSNRISELGKSDHAIQLDPIEKHPCSTTVLSDQIRQLCLFIF